MEQWCALYVFLYSYGRHDMETPSELIVFC